MTNKQKANILSHEIAQEFDSKEMVGYECAIQMANWKEQELLDKVTEFMVNCPRYLYIEKDCCGNYYFNRAYFLEDLKRAMKE